MKFMLCGGIGAVALMLVLLLRPQLDAFGCFVRRLSNLERAFLAGFLVLFVAYGGTKPPTPPEPPEPPAPTVYAIAYDLAGGVNAAGNPTSYTTNDLPISLAAPTREGYDFAGWEPSGEIAVGTTGDLTFTATWEKHEEPPEPPEPPTPPEPPVVEPVVTNTITYLGLEGAANTNVTEFTTNDLPLALGPVAREGYTFLGWTPNDGVIPAGTVTNVTFTANWEKKEEPPEPPASPITVPFDDLEELDEGESVDGAEHKIVVRDVVEPKIVVKGLPSGLKFDAKNSWIAGKPSKSGVYAMTVTVTDKKNKDMQPLVEMRRLIVRGPGEFAVIVDNDEERGTAKGAGVYASGKKITLKATAKRGFAFAGWYLDGEQVGRSASFTDVMGSGDRRYGAQYVTTEEDAASIRLEVNGVDFDAEVQPSVNGMCGVALRCPVAGRALSQPTVKVSGLPSGLKFTAKDIMKKGSRTEVDVPANTIYGTPTKAKSGMVKVTVTTAGKSKREYQFRMTVEPLPAWAVGTFDGGCVIRDVPGSGTLTVAAGGKASGKFSAQIGNQKSKASVTSASFSAYEDGVLFADMTFKIGSSSHAGQVKLEPAITEAGGRNLTLGRLSVVDEDVPIGFDLLQNPWVRKDGVVAPTIMDGLTCQLTLPEEDTSLAFALKAKGVIKVTGTREGKKFSGQSQLLLHAGTVGDVNYNGVTVLDGDAIYLKLTYQDDMIVDFDMAK